jgi:site-specific recombinase XerD
MMDRKGYDLELIQRILGHADSEMTLVYIDPCLERIGTAMKQAWKGVKIPKYKENERINRGGK